MTEAEEDISGFISELNKRIETHTEHVVRGNLKDFSEYQRVIGEIRGLDLAKQIIIDYIEKLERGNE